ncbi:MAG: hypothetical protein PHF63_00920 [Herbinix sp.]|nr:hypothetical protein [Herbinix sp.]
MFLAYENDDYIGYMENKKEVKYYIKMRGQLPNTKIKIVRYKGNDPDIIEYYKGISFGYPIPMSIEEEEVFEQSLDQNMTDILYRAEDLLKQIYCLNPSFDELVILSNFVKTFTKPYNRFYDIKDTGENLEITELFKIKKCQINFLIAYRGLGGK